MSQDNYNHDGINQPGYSKEMPSPSPQMLNAQEVSTPMLSPPSFSPPLPAWQVGASGIRSCINRNTYIWLSNSDSFWFFPTFVGRETIIGFRWRGFGWIYNKIDLRRIRSYQCF